MAKIIHTGGGTFIDTEEVAPPEGTEDDPNVHVYAYAHFRSLEHVSYGLTRTAGGPQDEEIDSEKVGEYGMEPIAPYWELRDAIKEVEREEHRRSIFEEVPLVEIEFEEDYDAFLEALGVQDGAWEKAGLYDARDDPPTYQGTVEQYELEEMERAADDAFDFMFQGEE